MLAYLARRLSLSALLLLVVVFATFVLHHALPGDPAEAILEELAEVLEGAGPLLPVLGRGFVGIDLEVRVLHHQAEHLRQVEGIALGSLAEAPGQLPGEALALELPRGELVELGGREGLEEQGLEGREEAGALGGGGGVGDAPQEDVVGRVRQPLGRCEGDPQPSRSLEPRPDRRFAVVRLVIQSDLHPGRDREAQVRP